MTPTALPSAAEFRSRRRRKPAAPPAPAWPPAALCFSEERAAADEAADVPSGVGGVGKTGVVAEPHCRLA